MPNCAEAMRNDERRSTFGGTIERRLNAPLRRRIESLNARSIRNAPESSSSHAQLTLVASSNNKIFGLRTSARAIASR